MSTTHESNVKLVETLHDMRYATIKTATKQDSESLTFTQATTTNTHQSKRNEITTTTSAVIATVNHPAN